MRRMQAVRSHIQEIIDSVRCVACGELLGAEAIPLAEEGLRQYIKEARHTHPGVRFRLLWNVDAICPHCRAQYRYVKEEERFVEQPVSRWGKEGGYDSHSLWG